MTPVKIAAILASGLIVACKSSKATSVDAGAEAAPEPSTLKPHAAPKAGVPQLGAIAFEVPIYEKPNKTSAKIGVLRLGAIVNRKPDPAGKGSCFYEIEPRGYVCVNDETATLDLQHPLVRAAHMRPDRQRPLPYSYAFVRAVAPLYLKVPTKEEQLKSEFKLEEHLGWYSRHHDEINAISPGANDIDLPFFPKAKKKSNELLLGQRYGSEEDFDPIPFWLEGGKRSIPNVSSFKVPDYAIFADRTRRHTGLSLIGAIKTGPEAGERPFAITTDLRLVPITKIKPDTGSQWHGVDVDGENVKIPFAFVRTPCDAKAAEDTCAYSLKLDGDGGPHRVKKLEWRSIVKLTGQAKNVGETRYRELEGGLWAKALDLGAVMEPNEWPVAANKNVKWVEVSIANQTLTLWEGKKPLYATLVSTGQDGMGDPKTSKSTVRGEFRIKNKFITSTMDSNERTTPETKNVEEGKTVRRGANNFELRDVPYVQFFEGAFALHVAYWHDVFGQARSHGCINLSPIDGLRVFQFTEPAVPDDWHGMYVNDPNAGTWVVVHR